MYAGAKSLVHKWLPPANRLFSSCTLYGKQLLFLLFILFPNENTVKPVLNGHLVSSENSSFVHHIVFYF
jgi:hypothetical protein